LETPLIPPQGGAPNSEDLTSSSFKRRVIWPEIEVTDLHDMAGQTRLM